MANRVAVWFGLLMVTVTNSYTCPSTAEISSSDTATPRRFGTIEQVRPGIERVFLQDDGTFPNNPHHPLLLFRKAFDETQRQGSRRLVDQGWTSPWVWGIFEFHHYHSNAWEVLVCMDGHAQVQVGGPSGPIVSIQQGDVTLIPPGVAHKQLDTVGNFALLGSYPKETPHADTVRGVPTESQRHAIGQCFVPKTEPITQQPLHDLYETIT